MKRIFFVLVVALFLQVPAIGWAQDQKGVKKGESELSVQTYAIPSAFLGKGSSNSSDQIVPGKNGKRKTAKDILESAGISFPEGASASFDQLTNTLTVINSEDQLELVDAYIGLNGYGGFSNINTILEYIETDSVRFHDWMFQNRITTDGTALRKEAQKWVKDGKATIIETILVNTQSGVPAKTRSVHEVIYPTEWDPPEIPNEVILSGKDTVSPMVPAVGSSYEMRKVGSALEVDPVRGADEFTIDLNLAPEMVQQKESINWSPRLNIPPDSFSMPVFHKLKITTQIITLHRRYSFLGAVPPLKAVDPDRKKPIVLVFVRGDIVESPEVPRKRFRGYRQYYIR